MTVEKAAKAGAWSALDIILRQGVSFVVSVMLARLLMPSDFGIVALVVFFSSLSVIFVQGLSVALIQRQQTSIEEESAVFWYNLAASVTLALVLVLIGPAVAAFYGYPVLMPLMLVAAAQVVFAAFGAVQTALLTRDLRFGQLTIVGGIASLASGALGVAAAVAGAGVWALALQMASLAAFSSAGLWWISDWRPRLHARWATIRPLFKFGFYISLSSALDILYTQGFGLIVGKLHGVRELGLYNRAHGTQLLPSGILSTIIGRIALPLFAGRADEPEALRRGVRMAIGLAMVLNLPAMIGLALLSDLVIVTLFGEKWLPAAPILSILALGGILLPLHIINLQLLLAQGKSNLYFRIEIIKKLGGIVAVVIGSFFGIVGLAWSTVIFGVIAFGINAYPAHKDFRFGPVAQLWAIRDLVLPTGAMALLIVLLQPAVAFSPPVNLVILTISGGAVYLATGLVLRLESFRDGWAVAASILKRGQDQGTNSSPLL